MRTGLPLGNYASTATSTVNTPSKKNETPQKSPPLPEDLTELTWEELDTAQNDYAYYKRTGRYVDRYDDVDFSNPKTVITDHDKTPVPFDDDYIEKHWAEEDRESVKANIAAIYEKAQAAREKVKNHNFLEHIRPMTAETAKKYYYEEYDEKGYYNPLKAWDDNGDLSNENLWLPSDEALYKRLMTGDTKIENGEVQKYRMRTKEQTLQAISENGDNPTNGPIEDAYTPQQSPFNIPVSGFLKEGVGRYTELFGQVMSLAESNGASKGEIRSGVNSIDKAFDSYLTEAFSRAGLDDEDATKATEIFGNALRIARNLGKDIDERYRLGVAFLEDAGYNFS